MGLSPGTVEAVGGLAGRYFASPPDTAASLGAAAARIALDDAGIGIGDIDCLIAAGGIADQVLPSNAALIHHEFGAEAPPCPCFDVNASCMGFLTALDLVSRIMSDSGLRNVLIVASDICSPGLNWQALEQSAIFGDGAAAAVIRPAGKGEGSRILASRLMTISSGAHFCDVVGAGSRHHPKRTGKLQAPMFRMNGKAVYKCVAEHLPAFLETLFSETDMSPAQVEHIVPHQASRLGLEYLVRKAGLACEKMVRIFEDRGNQISASLPSALDFGVKSGRIRRGDSVLLLGSCAGVTIGGMVLEY